MNDPSSRLKILRFVPLVVVLCFLAMTFVSMRRQEGRRAETQAKLDRLQAEIKSLNEQIKATAEARKRAVTPVSATPAGTPGTAPEKGAVVAPAAP